MLRRALRRLALVICGVVLTDQALQYTVFRDGWVHGQRVAPFDPPLFSTQQGLEWQLLREALETGGDTGTGHRVDPDLGWSPPLGDASTATDQGRLYVYDEHGARCSGRALLDTPSPDVRRVVAIGCSFTRGDEVYGTESWAGRLSDEREDLEIANLGVAGYGLDQALLRLERDGLPLGPREVWLGLLPRACLRNATHFPPLANHWMTMVAFKPRFDLSPLDELVLRPNPAPDLAQRVALLSDQAAFVRALGEDDPWVRREPGAFAPRGSSWMHHSAFMRAWLTWRARGAHDPAAALSSASSIHRRLLLALTRRTAEVTEAAGARFRLLVVPDRRDLAAAAAGDRYWESVITELRTGGIEVLDLTDHMLDMGIHLEDRFWAPLDHYSSEANALVAEAIAEAWLEEEQ